MAKVYNFELFKLRRELKDLECFLEQKLSLERSYKMIWFDHYSISVTQTRIEEIKDRLKELDNDCQFSKK